MVRGARVILHRLDVVEATAAKRQREREGQGAGGDESGENTTDDTRSIDHFAMYSRKM